MREREEKFCQAVAAGESYSRAYVTAGYPANRGNASRLANREHIQRRIAELRATLPPPAAVPAPEIEQTANGRIEQLEQLRAAGLQHRQVNAAVAAQREILKHEREQAKGKGRDLSDEEIIKRFLEQSRKTGAGIQEWQVRRLMGVVHLVGSGAAK